MSHHPSLMEKIVYATNKKVDLADKSPMRYMARAILATLFLSLATTIAFVLAHYIQIVFNSLLSGQPNAEKAAFIVAKLFFCGIFGWALVMILFMNTELFTSNAMYFSNKIYSKEVAKRKAAKVLLICFVGNFVGAILSALLFVYSDTFTTEMAGFAHDVVMAKLKKEPLTVFLQGIIANLVVNIAVILTFNLKDDISKIATILYLVFVFAFFGSEHVIANFASFSLVGFATNFDGMTVAKLSTNFLFSTLGNIVGGGFLIGVIYGWLNKGDFLYKDH